MNNVHEDRPEVFETRWAMSYLRGPLTRKQIKTLMDARRGAPRCPGRRRGHSVATTRQGQPRAAAPATRGRGPRGRCRRPRGGRRRPAPAAPARRAAALRAGPRRARPPGARCSTSRCSSAPPRCASSDTKSGIDVSRDVVVLTPITDEAVPVAWDQAAAVGFTPADLDTGPGGRRGLRRAARRRGQEEELRRLEQGLRGLAAPVAERSSCCGARR